MKKGIYREFVYSCEHNLCRSAWTRAMQAVDSTQRYQSQTPGIRCTRFEMQVHRSLAGKMSSSCSTLESLVALVIRPIGFRRASHLQLASHERLEQHET